MVDIKLEGFKAGNNITAKVKDSKNRVFEVNVPQWKNQGNWDQLIATERARPDVMPGMHADDLDMRNEMVNLYAQAKNADFTKIAVANGLWSNTSTWADGVVPEDNDKVLIPANTTVTYDVTGTPPDLDWVRVRGTFYAHRSLDTVMQCEHFVTDMGSVLNLGANNSPITGSYTHIVSDRGNLDPVADPTLIGRGVITHGTVRIYGEEKTTYEEVVSKDGPLAGANSVTLATAPTNWNVGDKIVISGTKLQGWAYENSIVGTIWNEWENETLTITAVDGANVHFAETLQYDHIGLEEDQKAIVSNHTRTVTFKSENEGSALTHRRGHVMFMHNPDVQVYYAAFDWLGRTDKSVDSFFHQSLESVTATSNIRARYAMHHHRTGNFDGTPSITYGCSVWDSPGWGYVHHDANADFYYNVAYNCFGAAFVGEDGNETGKWYFNYATGGKGRNGYWGEGGMKAPGVENREHAKEGTGFWSASRLIEHKGNIVSNCTHGHVWFHRYAGRQINWDYVDPVVREPLDVFDRDADYGVPVGKPPIKQVDDLKAFCCKFGLVVGKGTPQQNHSLRTVINNFYAWEVGGWQGAGFELAYTGHYTMKNIKVVGSKRNTSVFNKKGKYGVWLAQNTIDAVFNGLEVDGFDRGVSYTGPTANDGSIYPSSPELWDEIESILIDATFTNIGIENIEETANIALTVMTSDELDLSANASFTFTGNTASTFNSSGFEIGTGTITDSVGTHPRATSASLLEPFILKQFTFLRIAQDVGFYTEGSDVYLPYLDSIMDRATGERFDFTRYFRISNVSIASMEASYTNLGPKPS